MNANRPTLVLGLGWLPLAVVGCHARVRQPAVLETLSAPFQESQLEKRESFPNRLSFVTAATDEEGEDDITFGLEYERHLDENWGVGGLVDFFEGQEDQTLVAASVIYHPVPPAGLSASPGYQFVDGEDDRLALRLGMFYEFEVTARFSIAPVVYTDFIEGGKRASIIGLAFNYNF